MEDAFQDPTPDPYPELPREVLERHFLQGRSLSQLDGARHQAEYERWLTGVSPIFCYRPSQWGLRGDRFLWDELQERLALQPVPGQLTAFVRQVQAAFKDATGANLKDDGELIVERFANGGMSSGGIHRESWRTKFVPALVKGYRRAQRLAARSCLASEADFVLAVENEFMTNREFTAWFLAELDIDPQDLEVVWSRSDNPWTTVDHPASDGTSIPRQGETDLIVVLEDAESSRLALHIECKRPGRAFEPHQAEGYELRAKKWAGKDAYGSYKTWRTVLLAPLDALGSDQAQIFDFRVPYEQVLSRI